uniref:Uncharacterized protein n=1 Tax=Glossina pallidipes TaxID=7398 RepID=A0A1A9ZFP4_GLOPL
MDGWMDGWMDGSMAGWLLGLLAGCLVVCVLSGRCGNVRCWFSILCKESDFHMGNALEPKLNESHDDSQTKTIIGIDVFRERKQKALNFKFLRKCVLRDQNFDQVAEFAILLFIECSTVTPSQLCDLLALFLHNTKC